MDMTVDLDNLRQEGWPDAADEIERLQSCLYAQEAVPPLYDKIKQQAAEIEQLRALLHEVHAWMDETWEGDFKNKIGRALDLSAVAPAKAEDKT